MGDSALAANLHSRVRRQVADRRVAIRVRVREKIAIALDDRRRRIKAESLGDEEVCVVTHIDLESAILNGRPIDIGPLESLQGTGHNLTVSGPDCNGHQVVVHVWVPSEESTAPEIMDFTHSFGTH